VLGEDTPDEVFIDIYFERFVDLLCDSKTAETWVALPPKAPTFGLVQRSHGLVPVTDLLVLAFLSFPRNKAVGTCAF
jgi:hypothetical protein